MPKLTELIRQLRENPEDTSLIPQIESLALEQENNEVEYQSKVTKLQSSNRELLKMIPVPEPPKQPDPQQDDAKPEVPLMDQAVSAMHDIIKGG